MRFTSMRHTSKRFSWAAISLLCCVGSVAAQQMAQAPFADVDLPYSACGDMAPLRSNLTGTPDPSPKSDAMLRRLGVRCVGPAAAPRVRQRY
jgi:hypothetical protein